MRVDERLFARNRANRRGVRIRQRVFAGNRANAASTVHAAGATAASRAGGGDVVQTWRMSDQGSPVLQPGPGQAPGAPVQAVAPNPWAASPYGPPPGYWAPPTNTLAIVALVMAFVVPVAGAICGHVALGQIKRTGESGHGLALAGVIIGWASTALMLVFVLLYALVIVVVVALAAMYPTT